MNSKENKKVIGAKVWEYNGHIFRSGLELSCYKHLIASGLEFYFEPVKFVLWEGIKCKLLKIFAPKKIAPGKYSKNLEEQTRALLNMTYTPDFLVKYLNYRIYFDVKGKENDTYPIKKKMFLKLLEERSIADPNTKYIFFEPHSVGQMKEAIEYIKNLKYEGAD